MARVEWTKGAGVYRQQGIPLPVPGGLLKGRPARGVLQRGADQYPAITGMFAIINSDALSIEEEEEPRMELSAMINLGLEEGTTEEDVLK
ncbi:MAG: hypothetical protein ACLTYN_17710 [Dysosmobacter welbionis]